MMNDHDAALPSEDGRERLYCLRMLDNVLIVGNSGIKTTNDEDADLSGYVTTVQKLDVLLKEPIKNSVVSIEEIDSSN